VICENRDKEKTMDVEQAILKRRSVRTFTGQQVEREKLQKICTAAVWAPTGGNSQPWYFVPVTEPETVKLIKAVSPGLLGTPPAVIAILSDRKYNVDKMGAIGETLAEMDCCFAAQNILLRAHDLGLGTCVIRSFNQPAVREILKAPEGVLPELLVICGYPGNDPAPPPRRMDVIRWENFEGKTE
jgi:nitroreductase